MDGQTPQQPNDNVGGPNGEKWLTLDEGEKYAYIVGFLEGMYQGHCFTTWGLPGTEPNDPAYDNATKSYTEHWNRYVLGIKYQDFFDGLNKLYADARNRKIKIQNGMYIVMAQHPEPEGVSMESMIDAWRRKAAGET